MASALGGHQALAAPPTALPGPSATPLSLPPCLLHHHGKRAVGCSAASRRRAGGAACQEHEQQGAPGASCAPPPPTLLVPEQEGGQQQGQHQHHQCQPSSDLSFAMLSTLTLGLAGALALALPTEAAHAAQPLGDLAGGEDFFTNVSRYGRYFVTVMLGTGYVMVKPLAGLYKNPLTGLLATGGVIGMAFLIKFTLELMLGMTDAGDLSFEYVQGNF